MCPHRTKGPHPSPLHFPFLASQCPPSQVHYHGPPPLSPRTPISRSPEASKRRRRRKQHNNSFPLGSSSPSLFLVAHFLNPSSSSFARGYSGNGAQTPLVPGRTNERNAAEEESLKGGRNGRVRKRIRTTRKLFPFPLLPQPPTPLKKVSA